MPRGIRNVPIERYCAGGCGVLVVYRGSHTPPDPMRCSRCAKREYDSRRVRPPQDPEYMRAYVLRTKYGLTTEQYAAMEQAQGNVCAVCSERCSTGRRLAVDHDHATGAVRGLLCHRCNRAIGLLGDDAALLRAAAEYLVTTAPLSSHPVRSVR